MARPTARPRVRCTDSRLSPNQALRIYGLRFPEPSYGGLALPRVRSSRTMSRSSGGPSSLGAIAPLRTAYLSSTLYPAALPNFKDFDGLCAALVVSIYLTESCQERRATLRRR